MKPTNNHTLLRMRIFLTVLVLIFSLQSWTKADDIRDFEIEGMSIGDSLLDYFTKNEIQREMNSEFVYEYPGNKFIKIGVGSGKSFILTKELDQYEDLSIAIKKNDKRYKIYSVQGRVFCMNDIQECFSKAKDIVLELKEFFGNTAKFSKWDRAHTADKSKESHVYANEFTFKNKSKVAVHVYDWSNKLKKEKNWNDHISVAILSKEYSSFLQNIKY